MGGDILPLPLIFHNLDYFNPHLRMGGDLDDYAEKLGISVISIHTSVWEVTQNRYYNSYTRFISIHTSVWEVTCI